MRIKHFAGYGTVSVLRVKDAAHTLHVRVRGNHEWGIVRNDEIDLFTWLVTKFDKSIDYDSWRKMYPVITIVPDYDLEAGEEVCDYIFDYQKDGA